MSAEELAKRQSRLREIGMIIGECVKGGAYQGIEVPAVRHADLVYSKALRHQGELTADVVEQLVCEADDEMGDAGLSAESVDLFVPVALLLLDQGRFLDHFLAQWRLTRDAIPAIEKFVAGELTLRALDTETKLFSY